MNTYIARLATVLDCIHNGRMAAEADLEVIPDPDASHAAVATRPRRIFPAKYIAKKSGGSPE